MPDDYDPEPRLEDVIPPREHIGPALPVDDVKVQDAILRHTAAELGGRVVDTYGPGASDGTQRRARAVWSGRRDRQTLFSPVNGASGRGVREVIDADRVRAAAEYAETAVRPGKSTEWLTAALEHLGYNVR